MKSGTIPVKSPICEMINDLRLVEIVFHTSLIVIDFSTDKFRSYYLKTSVKTALNSLG